MGTWGPGNFENDNAAEHLMQLGSPLIEQIEATASDPTLMEPDEWDSAVMMCNLEILACLAEHLGRFERGPIQDMLFPVVLPEAEQVARWKLKYLEVWDEHIDSLGPGEEWKSRRREIIVGTFERLERLIEPQDG